MSDKQAKKRNGVFLVIVDSTDEFNTAIDFASDFANAEGGYVALLNVIDDTPVSGWSDIESRVRKEARALAEKRIWNAAGRVVDNTGTIPMVSIEEGGERSDFILKTIESNKNIVALVLASAAGSSNPGPLVTYFSGKGLSKLPVPLMVVPGHLQTGDNG